MSIWTKAFWADAGERAIKTFAQSWAVVLLADGTGLHDTDWLVGVSAAGMAGLLSVLMSVGGEVVRPTGTASFLRR